MGDEDHGFQYIEAKRLEQEGCNGQENGNGWDAKAKEQARHIILYPRAKPKQNATTSQLLSDLLPFQSVPNFRRIW